MTAERLCCGVLRAAILKIDEYEALRSSGTAAWGVMGSGFCIHSGSSYGHSKFGACSTVCARLSGDFFLVLLTLI